MACARDGAAQEQARAPDGDSARPGRPRTALVLSGGGAKGIAHVGVLKVLEQLRVPVDFVVGTSMGAIVGGLYASGWSPAALEALVTTTDWTGLFDDQPARSAPAYRQRRNAGQFGRVEFGFRDGGLATRRGMIYGQTLGVLLRTLTLHVPGTADFDDLPVPFRAVAADVRSGERFVFERGDLAEALRASMAVPGVFSPVELGDRALVDGGILDNFPVDIALASGAETIIAVYLGDNPYQDRPPRSLIDISLQVIDTITTDNMRRQRSRLREGDELVTVDLGPYGITDFRSGVPIMRRGEAAARASESSLRRLAVDEVGWAAFLRRQRRATGKAGVVDFVRVEVDGSTAPERLASVMRTRAGARLDLATLEADIARIYALGLFQTVSFRLVDEPAGRGLVIEAMEKVWGPRYLRVGFNASEDFQGGGAYTLNAEYAATNLNRLGGEWTTDLLVGRTIGLATELHQPFDYGDRFFVEPSLQVAQTISDVYDDSSRVAQYRVSCAQASAMLGVNFTPSLALRAGIVGMIAGAGLVIGDEEDLPTISATVVGPRAELTWDRLESADLPRRGFAFSASATLSSGILGADREYGLLQGSAIAAHTRGRHTVLGWGEGGTSRDGDSIPTPNRYALGGLMKLAGYRPGQLSGSHYGLAALGYLFRVAPAAPSRQGFYLGIAGEAGGVWESANEVGPDTIRPGGTLLAAFLTPLGPLYVAYGYASGGSPIGNLYVALGRIP